MSSRATVVERVRLAARLAAASPHPSWVQDGDLKDYAAWIAAGILAALGGDRKAHRLAVSMRIDTECPRATLDALERLRPHWRR